MPLCHFVGTRLECELHAGGRFGQRDSEMHAFGRNASNQRRFTGRVAQFLWALASAWTLETRRVET